MFTGIIETTGKIISIDKKGSGAVIAVSLPDTFTGIALGESVAVNGICLTVTSFNERQFTADISRETMDKTTCKSASPGNIVNLERSLRADSRLGGHFVQGHVDSTGTISRVSRLSDSILFTIDLPVEILEYTVMKGSVAIDGISLTIAEKNTTGIGIYVIPHTMRQTSLLNKKAGDRVNVETDILAKYVKNFITQNNDDKLSMDFLKKHGF